MPCTESARKKVGGCMRISAYSQDVPEHHMNKVMIASVVSSEIATALGSNLT
jgi:hypothetical protein